MPMHGGGYMSHGAGGGQGPASSEREPPPSHPAPMPPLHAGTFPLPPGAQVPWRCRPCMQVPSNRRPCTAQAGQIMNSGKSLLCRLDHTCTGHHHCGIIRGTTAACGTGITLPRRRTPFVLRITLACPLTPHYLTTRSTAPDHTGLQEGPRPACGTRTTLPFRLIRRYLTTCL